MANIKTMVNQAASTEDEGEALTAQEQQQLDEAMKLAEVIIHGEGQTGDHIAQMIQTSEDMAKGIGNAVAAVVIAAAKQMTIADDLKMLFATQVLIELLTLAIDAGALAEDEINEDFIDTAVSQAYSAYLTTKEAMGELDVNQLQQSVAEAQAVGDEMGLTPKRAAPKGLMQRAAQGGV